MHVLRHSFDILPSLIALSYIVFIECTKFAVLWDYLEFEDGYVILVLLGSAVFFFSLLKFEAG